MGLRAWWSFHYVVWILGQFPFVLSLVGGSFMGRCTVIVLKFCVGVDLNLRLQPYT